MKNEWELITGASSGIGKAFATKYATEGYNLILVARRKEKLLELSDILQKENNVSVEILNGDLSNENDLIEIEQKLNTYEPISVLINSAGFGLEGKFSETPTPKLMNMVNLHIVSLVRLTRVVLPKMIKNNNGTIINVSSLSAIIAMPDNLLYSATKSFINTFTEHLAIEVEGRNIKVQSLCPSFTRTEFYDTDEYKDIESEDVPGFMWMTPDEVVTKSINALKKGKVIYVPGTLNQIAAKFNRLTSKIMIKKMK